MKTEEQTTENNRLIAEFMKEKKFGFEQKDFLILGRYLSADQLPYNTSYSWIMPVVEKVERHASSVIIGRFFTEINHIEPLDQNKTFDIRIASGVKINHIYAALIEFIKWYNQKDH